MKLTNVSWLKKNYGVFKKGPKRKPLYSARELAEEFGVPHRSFALALGRTEDAPKPIFRTGGSPSPVNTWYDRDEVQKWWEMHKNIYRGK